MNIVPDLLKQFDAKQNAIFRGHANLKWDLKPSIGRHYSEDWPTVSSKEKDSLRHFKLRSIPFLKVVPQHDHDLEWLCLMQHFGCPTRLLDFTTNPLIALFFASDPGHDGDGEVIATTQIESRDEGASDVFSARDPFVYDPPHTSERVIGQSGCFIVCPAPNEPLIVNNVRKVTVPKSQKERIRRELAILGINHSRLFPGLGGVCDDLKDILVNGLEWQILLDQLPHLL
ncbi:FRG domain-containing protein [Prosthecobacter sp.]|uniref:FRG domain-containing protein n=1 Tax=Prosthecobacter sp. TaxID=1965333 RepID=UPI002ABC9C7F|nr:FRG domain-containing protein [Prosthecobacter sp.]MDZ4403843.1 FRG domain-containing protein [Prosthecobacter sp.]